MFQQLAFKMWEGGQFLFSFFGAFAAQHPEIGAQFRQHWPDIDLVEINNPFHGLAVRFQQSVYRPEKEDLPELVSAQVREISRQNPNVRLVLLRTECWGGDCCYWGQFILNGQVVMNEAIRAPQESRGVLRRLIANLDADIGPYELFEPLSREFPWEAVNE